MNCSEQRKGPEPNRAERHDGLGCEGEKVDAPGQDCGRDSVQLHILPAYDLVLGISFTNNKSQLRNFSPDSLFVPTGGNLQTV